MNFRKNNNTIPKNSKNVFYNIKIILGIFICSMFLFTSCNSDDNEENIELKPDGIALNQRFKDNRANAIQTFTINANTGGTIFGNQDTKISIPANAIGLNGNTITGNITIELIEIYNKSDMVLQDMSTKGQKNNGDEEALRTLGEFFINAKQNNTQLEILAPITVRRKGIRTSGLGFFEDIHLFRAGQNLNDTVLWREDTNGIINGEVDGNHSDETRTIFYSFDLNSFGWANLDRWYNFQGQLTDLFIDAPEGYNNSNTAIYLSYDGETGLAKMDRYNTSTELFTEHFGRIPVGQEVHFIMITEIDGQIYYAIQAATITNNHTEVMTNLQPISQTDLTTLIDNLP